MKVIVKANPTNNLVITPSTTNTEYGVVRLEATAFEATNGMLNSRKRVAFLRAKIEDLATLNLKADTTFPLAGKIVVKESIEAFYEGQTPKINPSTSEVLMKGSNPIYRITEFTTDINAVDIFVAHDKDSVDETTSVASENEAAN
jgi:hypothetical protein